MEESQRGRIKKRFCPLGHDKFIVGINKRHRCQLCHDTLHVESKAAWKRHKYATNPEWRAKHIAESSRGWQNPQRALSGYKSKLKNRIVRKEARMIELQQELEALGVTL